MDNNSIFYGRFHPNKCSFGMKHLPNDDCISYLPVELLLIIVSLLPLKEMVRTSILSKRWLNLWVNTPLPALDFHCGSVGGYNDMNDNSFVQRVNHVLQHHKGLYLKKFRTFFYRLMNDYQQDIDRWLEFALVKGVEVLELDFSGGSYLVSSFGENYYVFPHHWFTSGKDSVRFQLKLLKSLSLKCVHVTGEAINFFLRNCPFLERLEVVGSNTLVDLVISDPSLVLKYLQIKFCPNLKAINISHSNLVSLETTVGDLILKDLPMLIEFSIIGCAYNIMCILSQNATCFRQLKTLNLCAGILKGFTELPSNLAQMTKLKRLAINCTAQKDDSLTVLLYVLKSCNHLEKFVLELRWSKLYDFDRLSRTMQKVDGLSFDSLKVFEFKCYYGRAFDVELMMHVAMNAPRLEKIIINAYGRTFGNISCHHIIEHDAERFARKHIEDLRESKHILPHVDVYVRRCKCKKV